MNTRTLRAAWTEINLDNLQYNFNSIKDKVGDTNIIPIIKADAYGHGAIKCAWALLEKGARAFGVATLEEAIELREAGIHTPILILGLTPRKYANEIIKHSLTPVVSTLEDAELLNSIATEFGTKVEIFIALETGMGRVGFTDVEDIKKVKELPYIDILSTFSHFATADEAAETYAKKQIKEFNAFNEKLTDAGICVDFKTMANSAAIMNFPESYCDTVRPGIVLYGCYPSQEMDRSKLDIKPVMSVKANIILLKKVPRGTGISYGKTFVTERESLIGTLPLGYADGLPRMISGKAHVIVNGYFAPIVGRICMDQCMIDVTDVPDVKEYDEVTLMGTDGDKQILADDIGEQSETINYEVVCRFGQRLPKVYL